MGLQFFYSCNGPTFHHFIEIWLDMHHISKIWKYTMMKVYSLCCKLSGYVFTLMRIWRPSWPPGLFCEITLRYSKVGLPVSIDDLHQTKSRHVYFPWIMLFVLVLWSFDTKTSDTNIQLGWQQRLSQKTSCILVSAGRWFATRNQYYTFLNHTAKGVTSKYDIELNYFTTKIIYPWWTVIAFPN